LAANKAGLHLTADTGRPARDDLADAPLFGFAHGGADCLGQQLWIDPLD
jgi:hypothetical protein